MSTPDNTATQQEETLTVEQQVSKYVSQLMADETFKLPEEVENNEFFKLAITAEKRRRDTQGSFTKAQQALKIAEAERAELLAKTTHTLTKEQVTELEGLRVTDAEAYYSKRKEFELLNEAEFKKNLESVSTQLSREEEISRRTQLLADFTATHNIVIDDDVIENELPAKYLVQLEKGEVTFEKFLDNALKYLTKGVKTPETITQPDLGKAGSLVKDEKAQKDSADTQWNKTIF